MLDERNLNYLSIDVIILSDQETEIVESISESSKSTQQLSAELGCTTRNIRFKLKKLIDLGLIKVSHRSNFDTRTKVYRSVK